MARGSRRQSSVGAQGDVAIDLRARLRGLYAELDVLLEGFSCDASTDCCRFAVTGREPYPTALEIAELGHAVRARGGLPKRRSLPTVNDRGVDERRCDLLSDDGRCVVYEARPFGCRTFFCDRARGPSGSIARSLPRSDISRLARAVADLSACFAPADPGPRPLSNATAEWGAGGRALVRRRR